MLYDTTIEEFNKGNITWRRHGGSPVCAVLVDTDNYTPYRDHIYLDKVPLEARVGLPRRLVLKDMKDGVCDAEDVAFTAIFHRQKVGGIVIFKDTGEDSTSPLLAFIPLDCDPLEVFMVAYVRWNENGLFDIHHISAIADLEAARKPFTGTEWISNDDGNNPVKIASGKLEVWNFYGKVPQFPFRPEIEPWVPPYAEFRPDRWRIPPLDLSDEDVKKDAEEGRPAPYPYHIPPFFAPWMLPKGQPWRPGDWSPQNGRFPVPFPAKPDWMRPEPMPPHFNPKVEGEWGTAFESKPWLGPRPPLMPVIPEGQEGFFHDPMHVEIRRGASAELRFYVCDAHDHLIHHIGESGRDVTFCLKRIHDDGSEQRLTLDDKIVYLPVIPGEPIVVLLDQDETLFQGVLAFELVLHVGTDRYIASNGLIHITPAFGTIGDTPPKRIFPDLIYVKDYGAKGDGITDDTQAFLDAKEAAGETGTVYVDAGIYCLNQDIEGRFVALGVVDFSCNGSAAGSATLTNMYDDYVRMYGDETIHGVKTFADTAVFGGGISVTSGATINGGLAVPTGSATFGGGITVSSGATIQGGATVSGGMVVNGLISGTITSAQHATSADNATIAASCTGNAATATYASNAGNANYASNAGNANYASSAGAAASCTGNAATATTASKLGSATVGGSAHPIYLSSGTAVACTATVGGSARPVYMSSGTIVAITGNIGNATTPVYVSGGVLTPCTSSGGSGGSGGAVATLSGAIRMFTLYYGDTGGGAQSITFPAGGKWRVTPNPGSGVFTKGFTWQDVTASATSGGHYAHTFTTDTGGTNWSMNFMAFRIED